MNDPERLLNGEATSFEKAMIRSGRTETPPAHSKTRAMAALGVGGAMVSSAAQVGAGSGAVAGGIATAGKVGLGLLVGKWIGVGVMVGGVAIGAGALSRTVRSKPLARDLGAAGEHATAPQTSSAFGAAITPPSDEPRRPMSPARIGEIAAAPDAPSQPGSDEGHLAPAGPSSAPIRIGRLPVLATAAATARSAAHADSLHSGAHADSLHSAAPADSLHSAAPAESPVSGPIQDQRRSRIGSALTEELSEIDQARRDLAAGFAEKALARLDHYEAEYAKGRLLDEAKVVRIEALLTAGRRVEAVMVGDRVLQEHAESPYAVRVRTLLGNREP